MKLNYLNAALGIVLVAVAMTSCSSDDGDSPEAPKVKMAISSMKGGYVNQSNQFSVTDIKYDAQGRVTGYVRDYGDYKETYSYTYSASKIVIYWDGNLSGGEEYVVKDGLITACGSTIYAYDDNNQLINIGGKGSSYSYNYLWENGNPSAMTENGESDSTKFTFEYSGEYNVLGGNFQDEAYSTVFMNCDPFLYAAGYFGTQPRNLLSKIYVNGKLDRSFTYSSPNAEGYPTKMEIVDDDYDRQVYTFSWVKI